MKINLRSVQCSTLLLLLGLCACLAACQPAPARPKAQAPSPARGGQGAAAGLNFLVAADGDVMLKRDGWKDFVPTFFGASLNPGDQLQPKAGARAAVLCSNLTVWQAPAGVPSGLSNGCPAPEKPVFTPQGSLLLTARGAAEDPLIPYIIGPRRTRLLSGQPLLRWNPVGGVKGYQVRLSGGGLDWTEKTSDTRLVYPGSPALQPGVKYTLQVETVGGAAPASSASDSDLDLDFSLLSKEESAAVNETLARLDNLGLSPAAAAFARAQVLMQYELYDEAILELESLAAQGDQDAQVYLALAGLYLRADLVRLAEARYQAAVKLAQAANDLESLAASQAGLGRVNEARSNVTEIVRWYQAARDGYQALGDTQRASEIEARLKNFQP